MIMPAAASPTAQIVNLIASGDSQSAVNLLTALIQEVSGHQPANVRIHADCTSLNSVNGLVELAGLGAHFFKFHQEENEADGIGEYYNARVLKQAGYAVDQPVFAETRPGRQILIYRQRQCPRLFDLCSAIEHGRQTDHFQKIVAAQRAADRRWAAIAIDHLHGATLPQIAQEPIFQLFYHRTVDHPKRAADQPLGGRIKRYYLDQPFRFPGLTLPWDDLQRRAWKINGRRYPITLRQAFVQAKNRLAPGNFGPGPAIVAHGDAHNGNVWVEPPTASHPTPRLTLFDPAFAGAHVPALLAEVKASFHNIFAHPFWLYEPDACKNKFQVQARRINQEIQVETDFALSDLRRHFLESKATLFWRPLLSELKQRDWLDPNWRQTMRAALFACPTLVMNLRAGTDSGHNPVSSVIGLSQAIQAAAAPIDGTRDHFQEFMAMMT